MIMLVDFSAREFSDKRNEIIWLSNSGVVLRNSGRFQEALENIKRHWRLRRRLRMKNCKVSTSVTSVLFPSIFRNLRTH